MLQDEHPGAAKSLEEGLDETLTVMSFGLPEWLERQVQARAYADRWHWRGSLDGRRTMATAIKLREVAYPSLFAAAA